MPRSNILVVVVDGLRASALGAFGNTSYPTPALDQFAAGSLIYDWCYAPAVELDAICRALWQSAHPRRPSATAGVSATSSSLPRRLAELGNSTTLVTDAPELSARASVDFQQCVQISDDRGPGRKIIRVENVFETDMARLFAEACNVIGMERQAPQLVWVHTRGMYGAWDAPIGLQLSLLEEGDPPPLESAAPPDVLLKPNEDPDAAFRFASAYAAQVMVLDQCWNALSEAIETSGGDNWLVMLLGARGYPLGEHRRVGGIDARLYAEQLHVPWLIQFPHGLNRLARNDQLVSHVDLLPTVLNGLDIDEPSTNDNFDGTSVLPQHAGELRALHRPHVSMSLTGSRAIRTGAWCLRQDAPPADREEAPTTAELFVRPDDRWEANDVAKLCPDVVEELESALAKLS